MKHPRRRILVAIVAVVLGLASILRLEQIRSTVDVEDILLDETPARFYRGSQSSGLLILVSHGFAGSLQMMEAISLTLARAGHTVVAFDYIGHGRHPQLLSPDITRVTGTTEDLVQQTLDVASQARERTGLEDIALVGHSMATDVIVRAAQRLEHVNGVVAISTYSTAVTPDHPEKLLIVSGARETRLRAVALEAVGQVGLAEEDRTVSRDGVQRRAVAAPWVGHVGVLWSPTTAAEAARWLGAAAVPAQTGPWIAVLLGCLIVLFKPLAATLPRAGPRGPLPLRRSALATIAASVLSAALAPWVNPPMGAAGFGSLTVFLALWGAVALAILRPSLSVRLSDIAAASLFLLWGIVVFALALDRYAASFLPTGPRLQLMALLLPATILFALADRVLIDGRSFVVRTLLRVPFLGALLAAMLVQPQNMGMVFTVLPVMLLFLLVYGTMAHWASSRSGPVGAAVASGIILAWALAASTPLFAEA